MLSRRQFVTSTLAAAVAPASQIAIAQPAKRTIVDAQVHLWKAESEDINPTKQAWVVFLKFFRGHAATPPIIVMNSRRRMSAPRA